MNSSARALMKDQLVYEPFSAVANEYGDTYTYGTAQSIKGRVSYRTSRVRSYTGAEVLSSASAIIDSRGLSLDTRDRFTLPDTTQPKILRIEQVKDNHLRFYTKVYFE